MTKRLLEKCIDVCKAILVSPVTEIEKHLTQENFEGIICSIQGNNISNDCKDNLKPRLHLKPLEYLLSKNIFDDDGV